MDIGLVQADVPIAHGLDQTDEGTPDQGHQYLGAQVAAEDAALLQGRVLCQDRRQHFALQLPAGLIQVGPVVLQLEKPVGIRRFPGEGHHALPDLVEYVPGRLAQVEVAIQALVKYRFLFAEQFVDQQFLAVEIAVDGARADIGLLRDDRHGHAIDAPFGKHLEGCLQDGAALVLDPRSHCSDRGRCFFIGGTGASVHGRILTIFSVTYRVPARARGYPAWPVSSSSGGSMRLRLSARWATNQISRVSSEMASRITLAMALISGLTPRRTAEKISIGRVVEPGPETKLASTRSSSDRVKASSQPARIEGAIIGTVICRKVFQGGAPRSRAASSIDWSSSPRRLLTTMAT